MLNLPNKNMNEIAKVATNMPFKASYVKNTQINELFCFYKKIIWDGCFRKNLIKK
jgi:hypothetical protein